MLQSHPFALLLAPFGTAFTKPTWHKVLILFEGTLLAHGRRTVTAALRAMGLQDLAQFNVFHHVLNRARWSPIQLSRCLLGLLVATFVQAEGAIKIVIDETLERRQGVHISKRGYYYDSARSTHQHEQISCRLRWVCMTLVVTPPWTKRWWAFPFLSVLATSPEVDARLGRRHKTVPELAGQMVAAVRRWFPAVPIKLIGDETYSGLTLGLTCAKYHVTLIAPLRQGACLCAPAPARQPTQNGRPRIKGKRLPKLSQVLADPQTVWQRSNVKWYDGSTQAVEWCSGTALWYRAGQLPLPIRWVITRDPSGQRSVRTYFSTDQHQTGLSIVLDFIKRWSIEVTFEESRAHLGIETQRQWADLAIERSTPCLFGLYSLVALLGHALHPSGDIPFEPTAWYRKQQATFADVLATVRRQLWGNFSYSTSAHDPNLVEIPRSDLSRLAYAVCSSF
ncbi:MAG TPA: transposase [Ktedonobacteraceae bacterium]